MRQTSFYVLIHERQVKNTKRMVIAAMIFSIVCIVIVLSRVFPVNAVASEEMISGPIIDIVENDDSIDVKIRVSEENKNNEVQLWLDKGEKWVMVRETGIDIDRVKDGVYTINLTAEDIKNSPNTEVNNDKLTLSTDDYSLYVKYVYTNDSSEKQLSSEAMVSPLMLKSLDTKSTETSTLNNAESQGTIEINSLKDYTNKPVQVQIGVPVTIQSDVKNGTIHIVGDKGSTLEVINLKDYKTTWTPGYIDGKKKGIGRGIYYMTIEGNGNNVRRKVYVNSREYFHIRELSLVNFEGKSTGISVKTEKIIQDKDAESSSVDSAIEVSVGDPGVWSKTIKRKVINGDFELNKTIFSYVYKSGNYYIQASQKNVDSIEYEAAAGRMYKQKGLEDLDLKLEVEVAGKTDINSEGNYPVGTSFNFTAKSVKKGTDTDYEDTNDKLEYIFLLYDEKGLHGTTTLTKYSKKNTYTWTPQAPGTYVIYAKVRQKDNESKDLHIENSYEAEAKYVINIVGSGSGPGITIENVTVNNILITSGLLELRAHNLYTIKIEDAPQNNVMYKAYSFNYYDDKYNNNGNSNDGVLEALSGFTYDNEIPFYPKSFGRYRIIILAKYSNAGSQQASACYEINVSP